MTKFQRVYEAAVFKTLGATTGAIARMLLFEYGVLGFLAGAVGSLGAVALTWGVSRYRARDSLARLRRRACRRRRSPRRFSSPSSVSSRAMTSCATSRLLTLRAE